MIGGQGPVAVGRDIDRHEPRLVQVQLFEGRQRQGQMAVVDGIEGAAQDP